MMLGGVAYVSHTFYQHTKPTPMQNTAFARAAARRRAKAVWFALVFHVALFGAIAYQGDGVAWLEQQYQEWMQDAPAPESEVAKV